MTRGGAGGRRARAASLPSQVDPMAWRGARGLGGAVGPARRRRRAVVVDAAALGARHGAADPAARLRRRRRRARSGEWTGNKQYTHFCYSDVVPLWSAERLDVGGVPYRDTTVEYPVLTGGFMWLTAGLTRGVHALAPGVERGGRLHRPDVAAARRVRAGGRRRHGPDRASPALGRGDLRAVAPARLPRVLELGPARDGAGVGRALGVGARAAGAGRHPHRPGCGGEALSGVAARAARRSWRSAPAASPTPLSAVGGGRAVLGAGQRARRAGLPPRVGRVLPVQHRPPDRTLDGVGDRPHAGRRARCRTRTPATGCRRGSRWRCCSCVAIGVVVALGLLAPVRPRAGAAGLPQRARLPADDQGVEPAVLAVAGAAAGAGPAPVAVEPDLAVQRDPGLAADPDAAARAVRAGARRQLRRAGRGPAGAGRAAAGAGRTRRARDVVPVAGRGAGVGRGRPGRRRVRGRAGRVPPRPGPVPTTSSSSSPTADRPHRAGPARFRAPSAGSRCRRPGRRAARRLDDDVAAGRAAHVGDDGRVDRAGAEVGVPVGAGVEGVTAVVGVHEVDAAGDGAGRGRRCRTGPRRRRGRGRCRGRTRRPSSPTTSHSRASRSKRRATAFVPPAVFSIRTGSGKPPSLWAYAKVLRQFSTPTDGSSVSARCPPCTMMRARPDPGRRRGVLGQQLAARHPDAVVRGRHVDAVRARGRRRRDRSRASASACGCSAGAFQACGSVRKNCTASAPVAAAAPSGSSRSTCAPTAGRVAASPSTSARASARGPAAGSVEVLTAATLRAASDRFSRRQRDKIFCLDCYRPVRCVCRPFPTDILYSASQHPVPRCTVGRRAGQQDAIDGEAGACQVATRRRAPPPRRRGWSVSQRP